MNGQLTIWPTMGQIVPATVEAYLAGLNCLSDEVLETIATEGEAEDLPLVDPEVGALLQVLTVGDRTAAQDLLASPARRPGAVG